MTDERAILQSIAAEPENVLNRWAYADWMEEQGDAERAEFIRLQCELARDATARHLTSLGRAELKEREAELLEAYKAKWAGAAADCDPQFRHGFVERVTLGADDIDECIKQFQALREAMPTIAGLKPVRATSRMTADDVHHLLSNEACRGLRELDLSFAERAAAAQVVAEAGKLALERLGLFDCGVNEDVVRRLAASPHLGQLRELNLGWSNFRNCGQMLANSQALPLLEKLELMDSGINFDEIAPMVTSPAMRHLKRLNLSGNRTVDNRVLAALGDSKCRFSLRELELQECNFSPGDMRHIATSARFGDLESLRLDDNHLDQQDAQALAGSPRLGKLETLGMSGTFIGDEGVRALIGSSRLKGLRNLQLHGLRDVDGSVGSVPMDTVSIAALPGLARLQCLNLQQNAIDAEGFAALLASPHLGRMRELDMSGNPVRATGAEALAAADGLPGLRRLGLNNCELGNWGLGIVARVMGLRGLKGLEVKNNNSQGPRFAMRGLESLVMGAVGPMTLSQRARLERNDSRYVRVRE